MRNCQTLFTVGSFIKGFSFFLIFVGERTARFIVAHLEPRLRVVTERGDKATLYLPKITGEP